ncbi:ExbD/TolR family protein [Mesobacterium pallidum]|uniref:ExbD/TolR family protein n=1 Tax=Mesobacterium pallidum TaxID=2872037 RepID=UPI001EE2F123|nr:biopolymer transporter ExbD [Mesobacterium pallidum]
MRRSRPRTEREPTTALINIVFLMLIFFLVAGTLAAPLDPRLSLVRTAEIEGAAPADALLIHADGRLSAGAAPVATPADYLATLPEDARARIRLVPDRDLPATLLVRTGRALRAADAGEVVVVTERGLP